MQKNTESVNEILATMMSQNERHDHALSELDLAVLGFQNSGDSLLQEIHHDAKRQTQDIVRQMELGLRSMEDALRSRVGCGRADSPSLRSAR